METERLEAEVEVRVDTGGTRVLAVVLEVDTGWTSVLVVVVGEVDVG